MVMEYVQHQTIVSVQEDGLEENVILQLVITPLAFLLVALVLLLINAHVGLIILEMIALVQLALE